MSQSGVGSNRGDKYQICIALQWVIQLLEDTSIEWIEVDSTRLISTGEPIPVDDVVIGYADGREICCQCKKNGPGFATWKLDELADDLEKAGRHLVAEPAVEVRLVSRADYGSLGQLRERAAMAPDAAAFAAAMPVGLASVEAKLAALWAQSLKGTSLSTYDLLKRITFELTAGVDLLPGLLKMSLASKVTLPDVAFNALWTRLEMLAARVSVDASSSATAGSHRVTRQQFLQLLSDRGCVVAKHLDQQAIAAKLAAMSRIGRSWRRDIGGTQIDRAAVDELEAAVLRSAKVLLTDGPGAGKTCVLLALVERLEGRSDMATLFLQAREFADVTSNEERIALGLAADPVALVSAMSAAMRVAVVIDSLDVLSLARENQSLAFFLGLIDRLTAIPNVCVVAACRSFDLQYNRSLAARQWDETVEIGVLDWDADIQPTLSGLNISTANIDDVTRELISNPRNLALFVDIAKRSGRMHAHTAQELTDAYLDAVVSDDLALGTDAMVAIERLAGEMMAKRCLQLPKSRITINHAMLNRLLSENVLFEGHQRRLGFGHQTLLDSLAVRNAERNGLSLLGFIESLQPVPFVRPAIRAYFAHLRLGDVHEFRAQVRAVFAAPVAFHIKRLIVESYAALKPEDEDWPLIRHLFKNHEEHFRSLYFASAGLHWHLFWMRHFVPMVEKDEQTDWLETQLSYIGNWVNLDPQGVFESWTHWINAPRADTRNRRTVISYSLRDFKRYSEVDAYPLFRALLTTEPVMRDWLGRSLLNWAEHDPRGDALVWEFIASGVPSDPQSASDVEKALKCGSDGFGKLDKLDEGINRSDALLDMAVAACESWAMSIASYRSRRRGGLPGPNGVFIEETSFRTDSNSVGSRYGSALGALFHAIEKAILNRASSNGEWWKANGRRICLNHCGGLRHIGTVALRRMPGANVAHLEEYCSDQALLQATNPVVLASMINAGAIWVDGTTLDRMEQHVLHRYEGQVPDGSPWLDIQRYELLSAIPAPLRSQLVVRAIEDYSQRLPAPGHIPVSSVVRDSNYSVLNSEALVRFSDDAFVEVAESMTSPRHIDGWEAIDTRLKQAASMHPRHFLKLLGARWADMSDVTRLGIFEGATNHMRCRFGNLSDASFSLVEDVPAGELAALLLDELDRHPRFWLDQRVGATAVLACAVQAHDRQLLDRMLFHACSLASSRDPGCGERQNDDLANTAINCARGEIAQAVIVMANEWLDAGEVELPPVLATTILRLAGDCHPAVRAEILRGLAFIQSKLAFGWEVFDRAFTDEDQRVWASVETPLYHGYHAKFDRVRPYLDRMELSTNAKANEIWGRISALASLSGHVSLDQLTSKLIEKADVRAWEGAGSVWAANIRQAEFRDACERGFQLAIKHQAGNAAARRYLHGVFDPPEPAARVSLELIRRAFGTWEGEVHAEHLSSRIDGWLSVVANEDADYALEAAEIAAASSSVQDHSPFYDPLPIGTMLTSLFREAEERESADGGQMIKRVIALQDRFLSMPTLQLGEWLQAAERPGN